MVSRRCSGSPPAIAIGRPMFSSTVKFGMRLKNWNT
jgi:hypothetical protein